MKKFSLILLMFFTSIIQVRPAELESTGSIYFLNPTNGSTKYEAIPGQNYLTVNYGWTLSGWATSYTAKAWIDATLIPNPGYTHTLSYGAHTGTLELKEYDYIGRSVTTTVSITFSYQPSYYIFGLNSFGGGGSMKFDGATESVPVEGVTKVWGKSVNHTLEGIDNQTIGSLLRTWKRWTVSTGGNPTTIQITQSVTSQTTFTADFNSQPTVPTNFQNAASSGNVQISWSANPESDIQHYEVERKLGPANWTVIATPTSTSFTDIEISYDTDPHPNAFDVTAYYRVRAKSTAGLYSAYTNTVTINGRRLPERKTFSYQKVEFLLDQNYPNPFNPATEISYSLAEPSMVRLSVFNAIGQEIAALVNEQKGIGNHSVTWNASNLPSGIYIYSITAGNFSAQKKMVLTK